MAIIICPECQKEISDKSIYCSHCGYPLSTTKNNNQSTNLTSNKIQKKEEEQISLDKEEQKIKEIMDATNLPKRKPFINFLLVISIILFIIDFSLIIALSVAPNGTNNNNISLIFIELVVLIIAIVCFICGISSLKESRNLYNQYHNNPIKYKRQIAIKYYKNIQKEEFAKKQKQMNQSLSNNIPKCPTCGSTNLKKITATQKASNAVLFGLFGNKRKKQFHCNTCGYEW